MQLLRLPPEDLATRKPTQQLLDQLLLEVRDAAWSKQLRELLDFTYSEMLLRAVASPRGDRSLRRLGEHLERVIAVRRDDISRGGSPYFDRWRLLRELAERRVVKRETAEALLDSGPARRVLILLAQHAHLDQPEIAARLAMKKARLAQVLGELERWELIERRRGAEHSNRVKVVRLTELGRTLIRRLPEATQTHPDPPTAAPPQTASQRAIASSPDGPFNQRPLMYLVA